MKITVTARGKSCSLSTATTNAQREQTVLRRRGTGSHASRYARAADLLG